MKSIKEPLKGFVKYNEKSYPFLYENASLQLFPPNEEDLSILRSELFQRLSKLSSSENEWIGDLKLEGVLSNLEKVTFSVQDFPSNNMGFIVFPVQYLFTSSDKLTIETIDGLYFSGAEIDYFYPPNKIFKVDFELQGDLIESSTVKVQKPIIESMGCYSFMNKKVELSVIAIPTTNSISNEPIKARSEIRVLFSEPVDLDFAVNVYHHVRSFFFYICRRTNVKFNHIEVIKKYSEKRHKEGRLLINEDEIVPEDTRIKNHIIKHEYLKTKSSTILDEISKDIIYLSHLQPSFKKVNSYTIDRIILNFVAFEREYRNVYGENIKRSEDFNSVQQDIQNYLTTRIDESNGKIKKYFYEFKKRIDRNENSYADRFKFAINDCMDVVKPFIVDQYNVCSKEKINNISRRMNVLRNHSAHGNLDLQFEPIHLKDFKILEIVIYAMRLKHSKMEIIEIQKAIQELFNLPHSIVKD